MCSRQETNILSPEGQPMSNSVICHLINNLNEQNLNKQNLQKRRIIYLLTLCTKSKTSLEICFFGSLEPT